MPLIKASDAPIKTEDEDNPYPELGPYSAILLSKAGEITQFGVILETLPPGSKSSFKHWHASEDEFVYLLSGSLTLVEGYEEYAMVPGDAACFKAGIPKGHCLENRSDADASYLVVGSRHENEIVTYPDNDRILVRAGDTKTYTDLAGNLVDGLDSR